MLATRLVALRKSKNLKQADVALEIGITRPTYATYEQGRRDPSSETLKKLAKLFECSTDYLLGVRTFDGHQAEWTWEELGEQVKSMGIEREVVEFIRIASLASKKALKTVVNVANVIVNEDKGSASDP